MYRARKSNLLGKITLVVFICCCSLPAQGKYGGGEGTANDPYLIYTAEQMNEIGLNECDWGKHFMLCADIDLSAYTGTQFNLIGRFEGWSPTDKPFSGVFDGNDHKICNFTWISTDGRNQIGLFVFLGEGGLIKNLALENVNIDAANSRYVGSLVGLNYRGTVQTCYATGCVTAYSGVGGLVGHTYSKGTITGCSSATNVSGHGSVGGLAGENYYGAITDCNSTGIVTGQGGIGGLVGKFVGICSQGSIIKDCYSTATVSGKDDVGGLVGRNEWEITDCYATGRVTGQWWGTGGLVGSNRRDGTITNCCSTGLVSGNWFTGGLAGSNGGDITKCCSTSSVYATSRYFGGLIGLNGGTITACFSTGPVSGTANFSGGLVGKNEFGTISNCYSTSSVDSNDYVGGLLGSNLNGIIINSYCTGEVTGNLYVGGLLGFGGGTINCFWDVETSGQPGSDGGTGKTTAELQTASTFFGWNSCGEIIWTIDEKNDYPRLLWEGIPGQVLPEHQLSDYLEGNGTPDEPYLIYTAEELNLLGLFVCEWDKHFLLMNDIDLSQYSGTEFNLIGNPCQRFAGVFDGNHHAIQNFSWTSAERDCIGLFRCLDDAGQIKNLAMENIDVNATSGDCVGGMVGTNRGTISACYSTGTVSGNQCIGGLVGSCYSGTISDCHSTGTVTGNETIAGLLGSNDSGTIISCSSSSTVSGRYHVAGLVAYMWRNCTVINCYTTGNITGENCVGGLVAYNDEYGAIISNCYSTGNVDGNGHVGGLIGTNRWDNTITSCHSTSAVRGRKWVGGLIGESGPGTISQCFSTGSVEGNELVGGLVGRCEREYGLITSCYSRSPVKGNNCVGGLIGHLIGYDDDDDGVVVLLDCYSTGSVSGTDYVGGLVGYNEEGEVTASFWDIETSGQTTSDGGTGLPTDQMQMQVTFTDAGWDFVGETVNGVEDIWWILEGVDYPRLWFEGMQVPMKLTPGTLNCRSKGGWVKAHFVLPEVITVEDVDSTILGRIDSLGIEADYMDVFVDEDGYVRVDMAFDRVDLCEGLTGDGAIEITVRGFLTNGLYFYGTETIKIK